MCVCVHLTFSHEIKKKKETNSNIMRQRLPDSYHAFNKSHLNIYKRLYLCHPTETEPALIGLSYIGFSYIIAG